MERSKRRLYKVLEEQKRVTIRDLYLGRYGILLARSSSFLLKTYYPIGKQMLGKVVMSSGPPFMSLSVR